MTAVLQLRQVSKVYGEGPTQVHALREVDLSVRGGELVAVMGPSGSGKSTLLTIAGSLEEPTSGQVLVAGSELSGMTRSSRRALTGWCSCATGASSTRPARRRARNRCSRRARSDEHGAA